MTLDVGRATHVAIAGAGASGILTAVQLLQRGARVTLIEREAFGGVAYRTGSSHHLLNVRAGQLGGVPGDPDSFVRWARRQGLNVGRGDFLPRRLFRFYLADLLREAGGVAGPGALRRLAATVTNVVGTSDGVKVQTDGHGIIAADRTVLALGNACPAPLPALRPLGAHPAVHNDPWRPGALSGIRGDMPVLIVGTGLTAVDVVLDLASRGHRAPITLLSRHGHLPLAHCEGGCDPEPVALTAPARLDAAVAKVRAAVRRAQEAGRCGHGVVDALRPLVPSLWQGMSAAERDRFLRRHRHWWELHRHRVAPAVHQQLIELVEDGAVQVLAGRVHTAEPDADGLVVDIRDHEQFVTRHHVGALVNCSGPARTAQRTDGGPLRPMLDTGQLRTDLWGMGIDTSADGAVINARGHRSSTIFAVGPLRRGTLYESTAIPEIRAQAAALAEHLTQAPERLAVPA